ncbi:MULTISPECIES: PaaI family thioesterase [Subtercola]|uniref:PaaI family thioesterase n=1 Tax=Subtercola vilae TaxID=2056433 RepID=A0A4T2C7T4_9MICO|nr:MULTISPECIES: PaaI family thioesterase [Subtercola]MEA9984993.1 PaaI family thioesterase [Subtercola sp. RTI3]TIH39939.1 PaaI family thioesterase [Subtercola vilae]
MTLADEAAPALTGLEQMRAMLALGRRPAIGETMEFDLVEIDAGRAVFVGTPTARVYNPIGSVHGGYAATLLDSACGCAVHSLLTADQAYTTLELKVSYLRAMTVDTGEVRAEATVIKMGGRAAFTEARLTDAQGRLLATATSTLLVMQR